MSDDISGNGFWSNFASNLGQGFQNAGAILNPQVNAQQEQERQLAIQQQNRQKELIATQILSGIQNGSVDAQAGQQTLARLGFGRLPGLGPSPEAQNQQMMVKLNQQALGGGGMPMGGVPQAPQPAPPSMPAAGPQGAPQAAPGPQAPTPQAQPGSAAVGPATQAYQAAVAQLQTPQGQAMLASPMLAPRLTAQLNMLKSAAQQEQEQAYRAQQLGLSQQRLAATQNPFSRLNPSEYTPESLAKFQQSNNVADLAARPKPETQETPLMKESKALADLVAAGKGNTQEAKDIRAHISRMDAPTSTQVTLASASKPGGQEQLQDEIALARTGLPKSQIVSGWGAGAQQRWDLITSGSMKQIMDENPGMTRAEAAKSFAKEQQGFHAEGGALAQNQKDLAAIRPYKGMLDKNINIAIDLGQKAISTHSELANKSLNWLKTHAGDFPDTSEYLAQMLFVQTEAARVLNNPRLVGQLSDSARDEMQQVVSGNMPLNSATRVLRRIQNDGNNRVGEMVKENQRLRGQNPDAAPAGTTPAAAPTGKPASLDDYLKSKGF